MSIEDSRYCKVTLLIRTDGSKTVGDLEKWIFDRFGVSKPEMTRLEVLPELTAHELNTIRFALMQSEGEEDCIGSGASTKAVGIICKRMDLPIDTAIDVLRSMKEEMG